MSGAADEVRLTIVQVQLTYIGISLSQQVVMLFLVYARAHVFPLVFPLLCRCVCCCNQLLQVSRLLLSLSLSCLNFLELS